jgi:hypothetical protein
MHGSTLNSHSPRVEPMDRRNSPFTMPFLLFAALLVLLVLIVVLLVSTFNRRDGDAPAGTDDAAAAGTVGRDPRDASGGIHESSPPFSLILDCDSTFPAASDHQSLVLRYGSRSVSAERVSVGEGMFSAGTVLFPGDTLRRIEIVWKDTVARRNPSMIRVHGYQTDSTEWRTVEGITIGTDLRMIAELNAGPFSLAGFGWDYSGTVMSWDNGRLQKYSGTACDVRMRLAVPQPHDASTSRLITQVSGSGNFSSANPTMQQLNPRVYELFLQYH